MKFWITSWAVAMLGAALISANGAETENPDVAATIVVFNNLDLESTALAGYYAKKRGIAFDHLIGVECTANESMTRDDYDNKIAVPLRKIFTKREWWKVKTTAGQETAIEENKIRFIALMRGMPLKIVPAENYPGDKKGSAPIGDHNEAAVDSELAALGNFNRVISGVLTNPYYRSFKPIAEANVPQMMLVCRLDGPSDVVVRRMIDDSIETEKKGLWGYAYIDERNLVEGPLAEGDRWMKQIAEGTRRQGLPTIVDTGPEVFPAAYPMREVALYFGWYSEHVAGPFARNDFHFNKGAVACHIHSTSAETLRDPHRHWAAPLLDRGAAAVLGNVFEPYLTLTPNLDLFYERLRNGFTFAESAYASERVLSWMTTFVGDPLYRPFKSSQNVFEEPTAETAEWFAYRAGAMAWFNKDRATGEKKLEQSGKSLRSGIIFEGLGLLQAEVGDSAAAVASFQQARLFFKTSDDVLRVAIHEVSLLKSSGKDREAKALVRKCAQISPNAPAVDLLRGIIGEASATPTP